MLASTLIFASSARSTSPCVSLQPTSIDPKRSTRSLNTYDIYLSATTIWCIMMMVEIILNIGILRCGNPIVISSEAQDYLKQFSPCHHAWFFPDEDALRRDLGRVPKVMFYGAGPPCQGVSAAGKKRGLEPWFKFILKDVWCFLTWIKSWMVLMFPKKYSHDFGSAIGCHSHVGLLQDGLQRAVNCFEALSGLSIHVGRSPQGWSQLVSSKPGVLCFRQETLTWHVAFLYHPSGGVVPKPSPWNSGSTTMLLFTCGSSIHSPVWPAAAMDQTFKSLNYLLTH